MRSNSPNALFWGKLSARSPMASSPEQPETVVAISRARIGRLLAPEVLPAVRAGIGLWSDVLVGRCRCGSWIADRPLSFRAGWPRWQIAELDPGARQEPPQPTKRTTQFRRALVRGTHPAAMAERREALQSSGTAQPPVQTGRHDDLSISAGHYDQGGERARVR